MSRSLAFELTKMLAQWRTRVVIAACWLVPGLVVAVIDRQASLPSDTVFGRWMHASGWAGSLVVLGFACSWALPLLTSLVAGDAFAVEDRLGTWPHLLMAVRSPRRIFAAKALASTTVLTLMVVGLAVSSVLGGLVAVGARPLVGLDGQTMSTAAAGVHVLLAWLCVCAPTAAFAAVGLLGSVLLGRSPVGLLVPAVLALAGELVQLLPLPIAVRFALPSNGFLTWRGLFTAHVQTGPVLLGIGVALVWAIVATGLALVIFCRRDFATAAYDGAGRAALLRAVLPLVILFGISAGAAARIAPAGTGITKPKLQAAMASSYARLYRLQLAEMHRPDATLAQLRTHASCSKAGARGVPSGPGNGWRCLVTWHIPGAPGAGVATYQLDVTADGRYVADGDGPKEVNGDFWVHTPTGPTPNPLWQIDGFVDLLTPISKG